MNLENARMEIIEKFREIKDKWIKTDRAYDNIIGNAFEDIMEIKENNERRADFKGIEFKTQRNSSKAYITLFSKAPNNPDFSNTKLRDIYGYPDKVIPELKRLSTTVTCKGTVNKLSNHAFQIKIDEDNDL